MLEKFVVVYKLASFLFSKRPAKLPEEVAVVNADFNRVVGGLGN